LILIALRLVAAVLQAGIQYINVLSVRVVGRFIKRIKQSRKYPSQVSSW